MPSICKETSWLVEHGVEVVSLVIGVVATFLAYKAFSSTQQQIKDAQEAASIEGKRHAKLMEKAEQQLAEAEINNAWGILARQGGGSMGKREALETLAKHRKSLIGLEIIGTEENLVILEWLNLSKETFKYRVNLKDAKFYYCNLWVAEFHSANLYHAKFYYCNLRWAKFHSASLNGTEFHNADLQDAEFCDQKDPNNEDKWAINLSGAIFKNCWVRDTQKEDVEESKPLFPPHFCVTVTNRKHLNEKGEHNGYYIEIEPKEEK